MDKKWMGAVGAASALALLGGAASAAVPATGPQGVMPARSYAELLDPVPNAAAVLKADDERLAAEQDHPVQLAQYVEDGFYHHHHHHHHYRRYERVVPVFPRFGYRYHHHHHHHHHHFRRDYYGD